MKAWLDELVDGIYRGLFALIVLFVPTLALGNWLRRSFQQSITVGPFSDCFALFPGALSTASSVALLAGRGTNRLLTGLCCKPIFNTIDRMKGFA